MQYRSIIEHPDNQKITDRCEVEVIHECLLTEETYTFIHKQFGKMQVAFKNGKVSLNYGNSNLEMILNKKHTIVYNTAYGQMNLIVHLKKMQKNKQSVHLVYYLYDGNEILSKCYFMLDEINPILAWLFAIFWIVFICLMNIGGFYVYQ